MAVDDVDVRGYVAAELDRCHPERSLRTSLEEFGEHRHFAERDLAVLTPG